MNVQTFGPESSNWPSSFPFHASFLPWWLCVFWGILLFQTELSSLPQVSKHADPAEQRRFWPPLLWHVASYTQTLPDEKNKTTVMKEKLKPSENHQAAPHPLSGGSRGADGWPPCSTSGQVNHSGLFAHFSHKAVKSAKHKNILQLTVVKPGTGITFIVKSLIHIKYVGRFSICYGSKETTNRCVWVFIQRNSELQLFCSWNTVRKTCKGLKHLSLFIKWFFFSPSFPV